MARLKLAVRVESLRLPLRRGLHRAAALGVQGVQVDAVGDLAPGSLSATGRRDFRRLLASLGLELTALGFPARRGFNTEEGLEDRIAAVQKVLNLAYQLGSPIVVGTMGRVPTDPAHPARQLLAEAMGEVARYGDRVGAVFAAETGSESGATLRQFIEGLNTAAIRCNLDPANLLVSGYDPLDAVQELSDLIVHTHARDAVGEGGGELGHEVPLGQGDLDWPAYLNALAEVDYHGWFVVERHRSDNPLVDVANDVGFLKSF